MFVREYIYAYLKRRSPAEGRKGLNVEGQRHWSVSEPSEAEGVSLPGRCVYAQNDAYLELCNPGWDMQWYTGIVFLFAVIPALMVIWWWFGFAVYPLFSDSTIFFFTRLPFEEGGSVLMWLGWLLFFPLALGSGFLLYLWFHLMGARTAFFTFARGRIRFNRKTRKVYVLRPKSCGGSVVLSWDHLVALLKPEAPGVLNRQAIQTIALYQPLSNQAGKSVADDAIFVGPTLPFWSIQAAGLWEYIRRYMEIGPTVDWIPSNASSRCKDIPRYLPQEYTTYCGKPSWRQYIVEQRPGFMETSYHMLSQMTCWWPKFPKEWESDSGFGEPEERPVQTGAVMTAMVYRTQGKLSDDDEAEFLRLWGTQRD